MTYTWNNKTEVQAKKDAIDAQIAEKVNPTVVTKTIGAE